MTGSEHRHKATAHPHKGGAAHRRERASQPSPHPHHSALDSARAWGLWGRRHWSRFRPALALALREGSAQVGRQGNRLGRALLRTWRRRWVRRLLVGSSVVLTLLLLAVGGFWWRLSQGPIEVDMATPWLKSAIEQNFGGDRTVEVGGTQLERDENGRATLRLRDIVVRDADGTVVASAPKAEVGLSGIGLLSGQLRAQSLNLVGAKMAVRIEDDGEVTIFAGANKRPIATASPTATQAAEPVPVAGAPDKLRSGLQDIAGALSWIDAVGASGLDGHDLRELGLKNGQLVVDDQRNGKHWTFDNINASLRRPQQGGVIFQLASDDPHRAWQVSAAMRPLDDGVRAVGLEARHVSIRDILLALRVQEGDFAADLPLSASIRADVAADGTPQLVRGEVVTGAGSITDHDGPDIVKIGIERADFRFHWDARQHTLVVPFQVQSEGSQFTMRAVFTAPTDDKGVWQFDVTRGDPVIDPIIIAPAVATSKESFALNRVNVRGRIDTVKDRIEIEQGDFSRIDTRPSHNVAVAVTGSYDYSKPDAQLAFGVAGTRMPVAVMERLWPMMIARDVRTWVKEHVNGGTVERIVIAGNAPMSTFKKDGPPTPDDGLSIDIETSGTSLRPVPDLPAIDDADLTVRITGRTALIHLGRGVLNVAPGRTLNIADGTFSIPDTHPKPAPARADFRIDGSVPAVALLLANKVLRKDVGLALDPDTSRGTAAANVTLNLPIARVLPKGSVRYSVNAVLSSFGADHALMGEKLEAPSLQVLASSGGSYQIKGNVKIDGTPAALEVDKKGRGDTADLHLQAKLDEAARRKLGIDFGDAVTGTIPVKLTGKLFADGKNGPLDLEADLTRVKIDDLLPGWVKPRGEAARLTATMVKDNGAARFNDLAISGSGVNVKGNVELSKTGDLTSADFPVFGLSPGDKASVKAVRGSDGVLRVTVRGDVYDSRALLKSTLSSNTATRSKHKQTDLDLDLKLGTVVGHYGETLRGLDLRLSRRSGHIRNFVMHAKIGSNASLLGDLRLRASDNHQVIYIESSDAGALFRFADMYSRIFGGQMWIAVDPPSQDRSPQVGIIYIRDFVVRGEKGLDNIMAGAQDQTRNGVAFSEMHAQFTRYPGRMSVRNGVVRGPLVGATIEGQINYVRNDVHLRGTFVPFYGLNNIFGQIPIVGLVLGGGSNEGLVGITYEAVGPISAPRILINPVSAIAPGLLRKFIPAPGAFDPEFAPPSR